ncbi:MAG: MEKHLA domain-containing protein, partial [Methylococcales bacterium]|nr:MEKHLA domain-containing protein [Methylococcales bacterium]
VQEERSDLLERVKKDGFIADYHGIRVSKTGRRFHIDRAVVWNLFNDQGAYQGQAACFKEWRFLD